MPSSRRPRLRPTSTRPRCVLCLSVPGGMALRRIETKQGERLFCDRNDLQVALALEGEQFDAAIKALVEDGWLIPHRRQSGGDGTGGRGGGQPGGGGLPLHTRAP